MKTRDEIKADLHGAIDNLMDKIYPDAEIVDGNILVEDLPEEVVKGFHVRMTLDVWFKNPQHLTSDKSPSET